MLEFELFLSENYFSGAPFSFVLHAASVGFILRPELSFNTIALRH